MIPRRLYAHVKAHDWFAVAVDFVIVVLGVFVGMQVNNWNEARVFAEHERALLTELRAEMEVAIDDTQALKTYFNGVSAAGERALAFLRIDAPCTEDCWRLVVDFFHASQWTDVAVSRTTYDEMRREGLPRSKTVFMAAEAFYAQNDSIAFVLNERPAYRNLVRGLIPVEAQRVLWLECHAVQSGAESLRNDCPQALNDDSARAVAASIRENPDVASTLTQWASLASIAPPHLDGQIAAAERVIAAVNAELKDRP
jgi:hypothetical protein